MDNHSTDPKSSFYTKAPTPHLDPRLVTDIPPFLSTTRTAPHRHALTYHHNWHPHPYHNVATRERGLMQPIQFPPQPILHPPRIHPPHTFDPFRPRPPNAFPLYNHHHPWLVSSHDQSYPGHHCEQPYYNAPSLSQFRFNGPPLGGYTSIPPYFNGYNLQSSFYSNHNNIVSPRSPQLLSYYTKPHDNDDVNAPGHAVSQSLQNSAIPTFYSLSAQPPCPQNNHSVVCTQPTTSSRETASDALSLFNTLPSFPAAQVNGGPLAPNVVRRGYSTLQRPRRDYFIFTALTYELMARALRADRALPEYSDRAFAETAVSRSIPLSSAHHSAKLTRKKWMRLKCRMQWHDNKPLRRCLTWKSCPLIIVPKEDWPSVLHECLFQCPVGSPNAHVSFNLTYLALRKVYQTRRSRCGIPRDVCDAFIASTAAFLKVGNDHHQLTEHVSEQEEHSYISVDDDEFQHSGNPPHPLTQCSSSGAETSSHRSSKRPRSVEGSQTVNDPKKRLRPNHKPISITSLLSEAKLDSATELLL